MAVQQLTDSSQEALEYIATRNLITSVGVAATATLTKTDVEHLLVYSGVLDDISNWVLADLLVWGENQAIGTLHVQHGVDFWAARDHIWEEMLRFCKKTISKSSCYHLAATARAWPYERRRTGPRLSFEHHRLLAGMSEDRQEYWMDVCEAGEWSAARLRQSLHKDIDPLEPPVVANTPPVTPLWTSDDVEREIVKIWDKNFFLYHHDQPEAYVKDFRILINRVIGEYESERQRTRGAY